MSILTRATAQLRAARRELKAHPTAKNLANVYALKAKVAMIDRVLRRVKRPKLTETVSFDGTPCFRGHALMLKDARDHGWNGRLSSADRRTGVPERYGKLSQAALYAGWIAHRAGFNPANPPGRSTHELRSDGVAYAGPVGRPLAWWQLGLDATNADELRRVLLRLNYQAFKPYASGSEVHHTNLRRSPTANLRKRRLA